ncbi:hypothetical protein MMC09_003178 [Bachmanniomyces sp. S44760]|nr:hypothetical protein [Bachmanniomyces sp. S44760]
MREVNFSIPNVNKASVGITTALYDRRALDCTSTLPLINSLNHLAYLTTSSARIRDILTVDGGVERLVCILKQGRSREMMEMWKWNLAFQCVVNIGVRGSETVRTRVVEADMVPVIATILDNYIKVIDKCRERLEADARLSTALRFAPARTGPRPREHVGRPTFHDRGNSLNESRTFRRQAPPPSIEIPQSLPQHHDAPDAVSGEVNAVLPQPALTSPPERTSFPRHHHHHHHHRSQDARHHVSGASGPSARHHSLQPLATALPPMDTTDGFGLRPVRDVDRLPSMLPALQNGITSQPESPTTPNAPVSRPSHTNIRNRRRPSIRQQQSTSGDSDDNNVEDLPSEASATNARTDEPMVDIQTSIDIQGTDDQDAMLDAVATPLDLNAPNASDGPDTETFNITHRPVMDGSIINTNHTPTNENIGFPPAPPILNNVSPTPPALPQNIHARYLLDRSAPPGVLAATPRDEDVLMSLQLLAYVSKYCNLRTYFQQSHLVPKLKIGHYLNMLDETPPTDDCSAFDESQDEEYLLPDNFNIFPLVEKFTVRHHSQDMQYWAGVVMRNLCRKDDSRGGIRQCAYYQCGKWEQWTRQFAKCRRCRRTKYCSKECQKNAWVYHRHWCQVASQ